MSVAIFRFSSFATLLALFLDLSSFFKSLGSRLRFLLKSSMTISAINLVERNSMYHQKLYRVSQKKRGISECYSVCFTAHLNMDIEYSFLKSIVHIFFASAKPFLRDIRELRNIFSRLLHMYVYNI